MENLKTNYLSLTLKKPLVPSASSLSKNLGTAKKLEDAGAPAIVMHSLFEDRIEQGARRHDHFFYQQDIGYAKADSFHPSPIEHNNYQDRYLEQVQQLYLINSLSKAVKEVAGSVRK